MPERFLERGHDLIVPDPNLRFKKKQWHSYPIHGTVGQLFTLEQLRYGPQKWFVLEIWRWSCLNICFYFYLYMCALRIVSSFLLRVCLKMSTVDAGLIWVHLSPYFHGQDFKMSPVLERCPVKGLNVIARLFADVFWNLSGMPHKHGIAGQHFLIL